MPKPNGMRTHLAFAAILASQLLAAQTLQPIRYDDCGVPGKQPHVVGGATWTFPPDQVSAPEPARTVAFASDAVHVRYTGLRPDAHYAVRVTYATEKGGARTQTLTAGGMELHGPLALPQGVAKTLQYDIPVGAVKDGRLDLSFGHVTGPNAEVSEVWLLSDVPQPELNLSAECAAAGNRLLISVRDGLLLPLAKTPVTVTWGAKQQQRKETGHNGQATFAIPSAATGDLTITAGAAGTHASLVMQASDVIVRRPQLTPLPIGDSVQPLATGWEIHSTKGWVPAWVPGEWPMQGVAIPEGQPTEYRTHFDIRKLGQDWKIRFDAVFSDCEVRVNGVAVGTHQGGFTPFEVDVSRVVKLGRNALLVTVRNGDLSDKLASASSYAHRPMGGILRKVTLFAVPKVHLTRFQVRTPLDKTYRNATLVVMAGLSGNASVRLALTDPVGKRVPLAGSIGKPSADGTLEMRAPVKAPKLWECEHPNLYTLRAEVVQGGKVIERAQRRIGFRQVEVKGQRLLVNGVAVKLHGTCRHEVDPKLGRALTMEIWKRDIELLKGANINYVRTSHYPPAEEFIQLCDEAGIFVQEEAPFCWVSAENANSPQTRALMFQENSEMLERDLSHPSVIIWDLGNESSWGENFMRNYKYARAEDPTRPTLFSGASDGGICEIESWHYPGIDGAAKTKDAKRPVTFDEYCHLNCYNAEEVSLDPGLRDYWVKALLSMWEQMEPAPGCLGGAVWCWSDDMFDMPGGKRVGYGEWGPVDGLQRPKPEWWHEKMVYSPILVAPDLAVFNLYDFTNLSEVTCEWQVGSKKGTIPMEAPPHKGARLLVPDIPGQMHLRFYRAGRMVTEAVVPPILNQFPDVTEVNHAPKWQLKQTDDAIELSYGAVLYAISRATGSMSVKVGDRLAISAGPFIAASKLGTAQDAFRDSPGAARVTATPGERPKVHVERDAPFGRVAYDLEAWFNGDLEVKYFLHYDGPDVPVREFGALWLLPAEMTNLWWMRSGLWSAYPDDHIGRLIGDAAAFPRQEFPRPWGRDADPRGCADFRSSKYGVLRASLYDMDKNGVTFMQGPSAMSIRCTVGPNGIECRTNGYANGGGESFLDGQYAKERLTLKHGTELADSLTLRPSVIRQ